MDEEKAAKIIAKELGNKLGREFIFEERHKEHLINTSEAFYQVTKPCLKGIDYFDFQHIYPTDNQNLIQKLISEHSPLADANYFFMTNISTKKENKVRNDLIFAITPYALIGKKEKQDIKNLCYKDVPKRILSAMDVFSIDNYVAAYRSYINMDYKNSCWINNCITEFLNFVPNINYDGDGEINKGAFKDIGSIEALNSELEKIGIKTHISTKAYRNKLDQISNSNFISKKNIQEIMIEINQKHNWNDIKTIMDKSSNDFHNFIFRLPYEDQNIEINKQLLKLYSQSIDYLDIMEKEYNQGRHFQKYFECFDEEEQKAIVLYLVDTEKRNLAYDSILWSKGFKEVSLDYMDLYQNNADGFIKYFGSKTPKEKKIILRDIMDCDFTNKAVTGWLDINELDLIREVSMK